MMLLFDPADKPRLERPGLGGLYRPAGRLHHLRAGGGRGGGGGGGRAVPRGGAVSARDCQQDCPGETHISQHNIQHIQNAM